MVNHDGGLSIVLYKQAINVIACVFPAARKFPLRRVVNPGLWLVAWMVHIRDVVGTPENFRETFHDNGPTDMYALMKAYYKIGFDGPIRSDHVPTIAGESNENVGYEMQGNLFDIGYMKGLVEAAQKETALSLEINKARGIALLP